MNKLIILAVLLLSTACAASSGEVTISSQGAFSAGGTVLRAEGNYVSQNFSNWMPCPEGQT